MLISSGETPGGMGVKHPPNGNTLALPLLISISIPILYSKYLIFEYRISNSRISSIKSGKGSISSYLKSNCASFRAKMEISLRKF